MISRLLLTAGTLICLSVLVSVQGVESIAAVPTDLEEQLLNVAAGKENSF